MYRFWCHLSASKSSCAEALRVGCVGMISSACWIIGGQKSEILGKWWNLSLFIRNMDSARNSSHQLLNAMNHLKLLHKCLDSSWLFGPYMWPLHTFDRLALDLHRHSGAVDTWCDGGWEVCVGKGGLTPRWNYLSIFILNSQDQQMFINFHVLKCTKILLPSWIHIFIHFLIASHYQHPIFHQFSPMSHGSNGDHPTSPGQAWASSCWPSAGAWRAWAMEDQQRLATGGQVASHFTTAFFSFPSERHQFTSKYCTVDLYHIILWNSRIYLLVFWMLCDSASQPKLLTSYRCSQDPWATCCWWPTCCLPSSCHLGGRGSAVVLPWWLQKGAAVERIVEPC